MKVFVNTILILGLFGFDSMAETQISEFTEEDFLQILRPLRLSDERGELQHFEAIVYFEYLDSDQQKPYARKYISQIVRMLEVTYDSGDLALFENLAATIDFHESLGEIYQGSLANYLLLNSAGLPYKKHLVEGRHIKLDQMPKFVLQHLAEKLWGQGHLALQPIYKDYLFNNGFADKYDIGIYGSAGFDERGNRSEIDSESSKFEVFSSYGAEACRVRNLKSIGADGLLFDFVEQLRLLVKKVKDGKQVINTFVHSNSKISCTFNMTIDVLANETLKLSSFDGVIHELTLELFGRLSNFELITLLFEPSQPKAN